MALCPVRAAPQEQKAMPLNRYWLGTVRGWVFLGWRDTMFCWIRWKVSLSIMPGQAFSNLTASSFLAKPWLGLAPHIRVPV
ncbi:MAG: hypothetical protein AAC993_01920 [Dehalococcoides mccartyi]